MSPIYVRPAREQSEHDRLIRHLQGKYKSKKFEVAVNIDGVEPATLVKIGAATLAPDLLFIEGRKLVGLVEVETGESVNNLEAMSQWVHFSQARVPFYLYVPVQGYEATRRLCEAYGARVGELWTYRSTYDGFDLVRMHVDASAAAGVRGVKAPTVSIVIPPKPAPKPVEVVEPPKPVPPVKAVLPPPAPPKASAKPVAASAKPAPATVAKPAAKASPKVAPKPAPQPAKAAKREPPKPAPTKPKPKVTKPARPAKAAKPAAKGKKPVSGRAKKAAPRKRR